LPSKDFSLSAANLFSDAGNFTLKFGVSSVLLVEKEARIIGFFF
jgi:hypothetical protein